MKKYQLIISTIFLGAIGSGVWQYALAPAFSKTSNILLSVSTLGVKSYKDSLYANIAKGFREYASDSLLLTTSLFIATIFVFGVLAMKKRTQSILKEKDELLKKLDALENPKTDHSNDPRSIIEIRNDLSRLNFNWVIKSINILIPIVILWASATVVTAYSHLYENRAITYYQQSKAIIAPHITSEELIKIHSDFSGIKTAEQYYSIISKIEGVAKANNVELPKFEAW